MAGEGATVTFSFITSNSVQQVNTESTPLQRPVADALPQPFPEDAIREAFSAWSEASGITFTEVEDSGLRSLCRIWMRADVESGADIRISAFPS